MTSTPGPRGGGRPARASRGARRTPACGKQPATVKDVLRWLERHGERSTVEGMARYGIPSEGAYGVTFGELRRFATELGRDHALAQGLWASGRYEARLLAALVDEPAAVSVGQMNAWAGDFDSWAICDTVCFHLFDRTPHAWSRVKAWAGASALYRKRAAFALLWGLTVHDRAAADRMFLICLPLIEKAALDERELVKKGVDMALRAVGKRKRDAAADRGRPGRIPRTRAGRGSRLDREERAPRALRPVRRVAD